MSCHIFKSSVILIFLAVAHGQLIMPKFDPSKLINEAELNVGKECLGQLDNKMNDCSKTITDRMLNHTDILKEGKDIIAHGSNATKLIKLAFKLKCCTNWDIRDCVQGNIEKCNNTEMTEIDQGLIKAANITERSSCLDFKYHSGKCPSWDNGSSSSWKNSAYLVGMALAVILFI